MIAKKFNTTVNKLKDINNLKDNMISIGQKIIISEDEPSNNGTYIVKKGDTLYSIASNNNMTVDELKAINNLDSNIISIGQELNLKKLNDNIVYTVQKGDSLYSIARKYNTTVSELANINNLNSALLSIGQKLLIPNK